MPISSSAGKRQHSRHAHQVALQHQTRDDPASGRQHQQLTRRNPWAHVKSRIKSTSSSSSLASKTNDHQHGEQPNPNQQMEHYKQIRHISRPTTHASTSKATYDARKTIKHLEQEFAHNIEQQISPEQQQQQAVEAMNSISGQLMVTGKQPGSVGASSQPTKAADSSETFKTSKNSNSTYLISNHFFHHNHPTSPTKPNHASSNINIKSSLSSSFDSLTPTTTTTNNSTAHLHHLNSNNNNNNPSTLNIRQRVNLKYVKTLIISLMALDLLITVFVHQFSSHDELSLSFWFIHSLKLRFSLLNLILSSIWFIVLIGAIIFDIYFILLVGCVVDVLSFVLLLIFSFIHFTQRIDYNSVQLTSLLALLFSIIVLHVYLLAMAALTTYLMLAVRQRNQTSRR